MTYALRATRSLVMDALAAPIAQEIALTALAALGLSGDPFHAQGAAAHAFALGGHPVDLPRRLVRTAAVAFSPRVLATSTTIGAPLVRPGARANVNPACEVVRLR